MPVVFAPLDGEGCLYFEVTYCIRLTRSGTVCHPVTGRRLVNVLGRPITTGPTCIVMYEDGVYMVSTDTQAHLLRFQDGSWHGGSLEHVAEPTGPG